MATIKVVDLGNQETGTVELHDRIADSKWHPFIIRDAVVSYQSERQQGTHKAKGRSEVSGSTRKLYRQKGTGNARAGSLRSPIRRHGGVAFGPVPRSHTVAINKKVKKKALASVIGTKLRQNELIVIDSIALQSHKTRDLVRIMSAMKIADTLFVFEQSDPNFLLASRNLPNVKAVHSSGLNVYDALNYRNIVITRAALQDLEGRLLQ
jgi:large subunit ribosomal protein L4